MQMTLFAVAVAASLWAVHRLLSYAEERGWVYYRKKRGSYGGLGVTSNFLNMYDPSRRHLQEVVREGEWKGDDDDDGDPPSRRRFGGPAAPVKSFASRISPE